jgi:hypothetical protein
MIGQPRTMTMSETQSETPRRGQLVCRSCSALPDDDAATGGRCPWCRGQLSREYGVIVARCGECGTRGIVGVELGVRDYEKGTFRVPRAVCLVHPDAPGAQGGTGPVTRPAAG